MSGLDLFRSPSRDQKPKDRIQCAAEQLFLVLGTAVTLREIARHADTNEATVIKYHRSKDHLVAQFLRKLFYEANRNWDMIGHENPQDARGQINSWIGLAEDDAVNPQSALWQLHRLMAQLAHVLQRPLLDDIERHRQSERRRLIELCTAAGLIEPAVVADKLILLVHGLCSLRGSYGYRGPEVAFSSAIRDLMAAHAPQCEAVHATD